MGTKYLSMRQQGDVIFKEIAEVPDGAKPKKDFKGVFAEGEVTGHRHSTTAVADIAVFDGDDGVVFADIKKSVTVDHQEHGAVVVPESTREIGIVREVDPFKDAVRRVAD